MKFAERSLPDPVTEPTIAVARAAAIVGVSTRHGYVAAERGEWPSIKVGRSVRIPTLRWLREVGLLDESAESNEKADATAVTSINDGPSHAVLTAQRRLRGTQAAGTPDPEGV